MAAVMRAKERHLAFIRGEEPPAAVRASVAAGTGSGADAEQQRLAHGRAVDHLMAVDGEMRTAIAAVHLSTPVVRKATRAMDEILMLAAQQCPDGSAAASYQRCLGEICSALAGPRMEVVTRYKRAVKAALNSAAKAV